MTHRVLALAAQGPSEPSVRIRIAEMARPLRRDGIELQLTTLFSDELALRFDRAGVAGKAHVALEARRRLRQEIERNARDTTLVHRRADMLPSLRLERAATRAGRLVYDVDDAIWLDARREGSHPLAFLKGSPRKVRWLATRADHVIAANANLAEHLSRFDPSVAVVPSVVDTDAIAVRTHTDREETTIGWIGSPTTAPYLAAAIGRLDGRFKLLVVGGSVRPPLEAPYEEHEWSPQAESDALARIDIGLMPLPDSEWTRGKSAYKAILYMAAGIPVVADDVGVTRETVGPGGFVVRGAGEWAEALEALAADATLRARIGAAGRSHVEKHYSLSRWAPELGRLLRE